MTYPPLFEPEDYQEHLPSRMSQEYGEVMEITAELESAVICDPVGGIHLDGPLSYAAFCEIPRADRESLPPLSAPWALDFLIPLRAANASGVTMPNVDDRLLWHGNVWFWMCTDNLTPWEGMHAAPVRGPTCHREMIRHSNDRRVNISAGAYKPVNHSYPARWPEGGVLRWLAIGDVDEVRRLLTTHVHALGRRHNTGHGLVRSWTVTTTSGETDDILPHRRTPSVSLPARMGSIRAPYHHRSRLTYAEGPG